MTPRQGETLDYLIELARSLHTYGASADRLEAAVTNASLSLGMGAAVFSTPTMLTLVFQFPDEAGKRVEITRLLRVIPSSIDLDKLTQTDKMGDLVVNGKMTPDMGLEGLKVLQAREPLFPASLRGNGLWAFFDRGLFAIRGELGRAANFVCGGTARWGHYRTVGRSS